jgi:hypothetical protein
MRAMWTGVGLLGAVMSAITYGLCKAAQRGDEPVKGYLDRLCMKQDDWDEIDALLEAERRTWERRP